MAKINALKKQNDRWGTSRSVGGCEFYADPLTMSNAQPQLFKPGLGTHDSGPRAGDIGYPDWSEASFNGVLFLPPGPSSEGIGFVSRSIMTGSVLLRKSKTEFITKIVLNNPVSPGIQGTSGARINRDPEF